MIVALVDYEMGNLGSVRRALEELGATVLLAQTPDQAASAGRVVLPGVGAFQEGMARLRAAGWDQALRRTVEDGSRPLLGICLGMQMLASTSEEHGSSEGLNLIPGRVGRLDDLGCTLRIPHIGWNEVALSAPTPLFETIPSGSDFYFVHSYAFVPDSEADVAATANYGVSFAAAVRRGNIFGTQFHPEKSSKAGRRILENFLRYVPC